MTLEPRVGGRFGCCGGHGVDGILGGVFDGGLSHLLQYKYPSEGPGDNVMKRAGLVGNEAMERTLEDPGVTPACCRRSLNTGLFGFVAPQTQESGHASAPSDKSERQWNPSLA